MAESSLEIIHTVADLRARVRHAREAGAGVGLVPTMGALHEGHLELVRRALSHHRFTVATLFVNPKQFGPNEDFARYPRDEARDASLLAAAGVPLLFAPSVAEMYPEGHATEVRVHRLGDILEGEFRPGFFLGVATVVTKLLLQAMPDEAFFGEKDYQQLRIVKCLVRDLALPFRIVGVPTVRESDGLAISSRNVYLSEQERAVAPILHGTLAQVAENVSRGADPAEQAAWAREQLMRGGFAKVDYVAVRDAETLDEIRDLSRPARVLGAAWLGRTRLIDNLAV